MSSWKLAVLGVMIAAVPARAELERVAPGTAPDTAALSGMVLVWSDARLHLDPTDKAATVQLMTLDVSRADAAERHAADLADRDHDDRGHDGAGSGVGPAR